MNLRHSLRRRLESPVDLLRDSALGTAISHLPDAMRWVMILGGRNGLSTDEIAALAGVSPKLVESTQHRGTMLVQRELSSHSQGAS